MQPRIMLREHVDSGRPPSVRWVMWSLVLTVACTVQFGTQVLAPPVGRHLATGMQDGLRLVVAASQAPTATAEEKEPAADFYKTSSVDAQPTRARMSLEVVPLGQDRYEIVVPPNAELQSVDLAVLCPCRGCRCGPCRSTEGNYLRILEQSTVSFWRKDVEVEFQRGPIPRQATEQSFSITLGLPQGSGIRVVPKSERLLEGTRPPEALLTQGAPLHIADYYPSTVLRADVTLHRGASDYDSPGPRSLRLTLTGPCRDAGGATCQAPADLAMKLMRVDADPTLPTRAGATP